MLGVKKVEITAELLCSAPSSYSFYVINVKSELLQEFQQISEAEAAAKQRQCLPPLHCTVALLLKKGGLGALLSSHSLLCVKLPCFSTEKEIFPGVLCLY